MHKLCEYCQQPGLIEVNIKNKKAYLCNSCGKTNQRFIQSDGDIVSLDTSHGIKHIAVGGLIYDEKGRILMVKRRVWPYYFDFPAGHLDYNENPKQAINREILEETGLIVDTNRLLYNGIIKNDHCRYGASIHEWFFFECSVKNTVSFKNSELDSIHWIEREKLNSMNLLPASKFFVDHIIKNKSQALEIKSLPVYHKSNLLREDEKKNELIYHISTALLETENSENIIRVAAQEARNATGVDSLQVFLNDEETGDFKLQTRLAKLDSFEQLYNIAKECQIRQKNIMKMVDDDHTIFAIPMVANGRSLGVVIAENFSNKMFTERETQFLSILTNEIAVSTANSRLLKKIKSENDLLNNIVDNSGEGILVLDSQGKIITINAYLEKLYGVKKEDVIGLDNDIFSKGHGTNLHHKKIMSAIKSGTQSDSMYDEVKVTLPSGEKYWFGRITSFIRGPQNEINGVVILTRNITEEKKLIQAKDELITTATHELRTPLTAIKGYLSMMLDEKKAMNGKQAKYLEKAYGSTERLVSLVEDLLSTLRIDEDRVNLELSNFDISKVILESIDNLKTKARAKKIKLKFQQAQLFVYGDPIKSKHILENLIDNAIKYTHNSGLIDIAVKNQTHNILVSIKDTGVGIPREYQASVFDRFMRVNNTLSIKAGGTGLGLFIAKSLVEKQGGKIWLESNQQEGTTFYFTVPASTAFNK